MIYGVLVFYWNMRSVFVIKSSLIWYMYLNVREFLDLEI